MFAKTSKKWQLVMYITFVAGACAFFISTLITPKYESKITILIVQGDANASAASQSVAYLSDVFSYVVHTELFFEDVMKSRFDIEGSFEGTPLDQRKQWIGEVDVEKNSDAGILKITVENESRSQAHLIAQAIAENFATNSQKYHGSSDNVIAKLIDGPITSLKPTVPNIPLNTGFGLLIGLAGSLVVIFFFDSFDLKVVGKKAVTDSLVREQVEKQIRKREEQKELVYQDEQKNAYAKQTMTHRTDGSEPREKTIPMIGMRQQQSQGPTPDLEGSMIDAKEFEIQMKTDSKTHHAAVETKSGPANDKVKDASPKGGQVMDREPAKGASQNKNILSKLYGKSLFADEKFRNLQSERASHKREVDNNQLPVVESVKKVKSPDAGAGIGPKNGKKAAAPENLPIFLEEEKSEDTKEAPGENESKGRAGLNVAETGKDGKKQQSSDEKNVIEQDKLGLVSNYKEFEPIEHVGGPGADREQAEKPGELDAGKGDGTAQRDIAAPFENLIELDESDEQESKPVDREPSEDEVKERLNKLLKGEL